MSEVERDSLISEMRERQRQLQAQQQSTAPDPRGANAYMDASPNSRIPDQMASDSYESARRLESTVSQQMMTAEPEEEEAEVEEKEDKEPILTADLSKNEDWRKAASTFARKRGETMTDDEAAEWAIAQLGGFNWNLYKTVSMAHDVISSDDKEYAEAFLHLLTAYEDSDGGAREFGNAIKWLLLDPTTYTGLGVGAVASKGAARLTAKKTLSRMLKYAIAGGTTGAVEGAAVTGGEDVAKQMVAIEAGAQEDVDWSQSSKMAAMGGLFGFALAGGGGALAGRWADNMAARVDKEIASKVDDVAPTPFDGETVTTKEVIRAPTEPEAEALTEVVDQYGRRYQDIPEGTKVGAGTKVESDGEIWQVIDYKNGWYSLAQPTKGLTKKARRATMRTVETPDAPMKPGRVNLGNISDPADRQVARLMEEVDATPTQKMTHKQAIQTAKELNEQGVDVTARELESHWSPEDVVLLRANYEKRLNELSSVLDEFEAQKAQGIEYSDHQLAQFNVLHAKVAQTRDLFAGVAGNAARVLGVLNSRVGYDEFKFAQNIIDAIDIQGSRRATADVVDTMIRAKKVGKLPNTSKKLFGRPRSVILDIRYNLMLSSVRTHVANFVGNTSTWLYDQVAIGFGKTTYQNVEYFAKKTLGLPVDESRMKYQTWAKNSMHAFASTRDGLLLARKILKGETVDDPDFFGGKIANELGLRYHYEQVPDSMFGKMGTTPVRALEAMDSFFKMQYRNMELRNQADTIARQSETMGMDYDEVFAEALMNPTDAMMAAAKDKARQMTFTNDPSIYGSLFGNLAKSFEFLQHNNTVMNALIPFVRTPVNLLGYATRVVGADWVRPDTYKIIMGQGTAAQRQELIARMGMAAGAWAMISSYYRDGKITGDGPPTWQEKQTWEAAGRPTNSIMVGGQWVSLERIEPLGLAINIIATTNDVLDLASTEQEQDRLTILAGGFMQVTEMLKDRSWFSTLADVISAIEAKGEGRLGSQIAGTLLSYVTPNIARDFRMAADEGVRDMSSADTWTTLKKRWMNAFPYLSNKLPPKRDWKGDTLSYYDNAYVRGLIPVQIKDPEKSDPASMALANARIPIRKPGHKVGLPGGVNIDTLAMDGGKGWVYNKYQEMVGRERKFVIDSLMADPVWAELVADDNVGPGSQGEDFLNRAMSTGTRIGKSKFIAALLDGELDIRDGEGNKVEFVAPDLDEILESAESAAEGMIDVSTDTLKVKERRPTPPQLGF